MHAISLRSAQDAIINQCKEDATIQMMLDEEIVQLKKDQADLRVVMANRGSGIIVSNDMSYAPGNIKVSERSERALALMKT